MRIIIYHSIYIAMMFWNSQNVTVIKNFPCHNISANNDRWIIILGESLLTVTRVGVVSIYSWFYSKKREHWVKPRFLFFVSSVNQGNDKKLLIFSSNLGGEKILRNSATSGEESVSGERMFKWGARLWMHGICKYMFIYGKIWSHLKD